MSESNLLRVGYARVSTAEQNLDMQIAALKEYGVPDHLIFTDKISGAKSKRPGLEAAKRACRRGGAELVVWKLDRLGRTVLGIINLMGEFDETGVGLVSLTERFDLSTPMGKAMLHIMAAMAQMERDLIQERTKAGVRAAIERGGIHGRKQAMTPERVERATEMVLAGFAVRDILAALQAIDGPQIGRSRVYQWIRDFKAQQPDDAEAA